MRLFSRQGFLFLLLGLSVSSSAAQEPRTSFLLPAGIVDPSRRTGIVANAAGGLDVLDLATGQLLWETKEATRPILVLGERLYAEAAVERTGMRLVAFDLATGGPNVFQSEPVEFPDWVQRVESSGHSFKASWHQEGKRLVLTWEASARADRGTALFRLTGKAAAKPGKVDYEILTGQVDALEPESRNRRAAGRTAFDLENGKVEILSTDPTPLPKPRHAPNEAGRHVLRWQSEIGGNFTAVSLDQKEEQQSMVLRSWDRVTGKQANSRPMLRGKRLVILPTLDDRYLCIRDSQPSPDQGTPTADRKGNFGWTLYSPQTGAEVARLPYQPGTLAVVFAAPRAYFLVAAPLRGSIEQTFVRPQILRAVDASTGKTLWERPVAGKRTVPAGT